MSIAENIAGVRERIGRAADRAGRPAGSITLMAITKTAGPDGVREAFAAGVRHFGESRVQEAERKLAALADLRPETTWHMVGNLQSNKAKIAAQVFDIIHSVASVRLGVRLDGFLDRPMPVFLEVNIAGEAAKHGFPPEGLEGALQQLRRCAHLDVRGLMAVAPLVSDPEEVRPLFRRMRELAEVLGLPELSMGMSNDFEVAVEEGATVVRIGRAIFGG